MEFIPIIIATIIMLILAYKNRNSSGQDSDDFDNFDFD